MTTESSHDYVDQNGSIGSGSRKQMKIKENDIKHYLTLFFILYTQKCPIDLHHSCGVQMHQHGQW